MNACMANSKDRVWLSVAACTLQGLHAENVTMQPYPLHSTFFSDRSPGIDPEHSQAVYGDLQAAGIIDESGYSNFPSDQATEDVQCVPEDYLPLLAPSHGAGWFARTE